MHKIEFRVANMKQLKTKVEAFRVLFDTEPSIGVRGDIRASDGDTAFLKNAWPVAALGRTKVTVDLREEGRFDFDVEDNAQVAVYSLSETKWA